MRSVHIDTERTFRGGEQQALLLGKGLVERGDEVLMVGQPDRPFAARCRATGLPTEEVRMRGEVDLLAVARLRRLLLRFRPDIVHMHTSHAHMLGVLAARAAGTGRTIVSRRVVFSIHRSALRANILKYQFGVDRYIAISEAVRETLINDGVPGAWIDVVSSGVDISDLAETPCIDFRSEFNIPPAAPIVGNVAHFGWDKAQEVLVEACPYLWRADPEIRILLVGDGERRSKVEEAARALGPDDRLIFTGHRDDARALIRWFDVFVICSVKEGLCTSILDAHVLGTPVAATRVGGIPEVARDGESGLLFPLRDAGALAGAVNRLLGDRERGAAMSRAGRELVVERFSVEAMVEGTRAVYRRVLSSAKR